MSLLFGASTKSFSADPIVQWKVNKQEINKNLKFKKGVGITIKSKETSGKLAIYTLQAALATNCVCSCKQNSRD